MGLGSNWGDEPPVSYTETSPILQLSLHGCGEHEPFDRYASGCHCTTRISACQLPPHVSFLTYRHKVPVAWRCNQPNGFPERDKTLKFPV